MDFASCVPHSNIVNVAQLNPKLEQLDLQERPPRIVERRNADDEREDITQKMFSATRGTRLLSAAINVVETIDLLALAIGQVIRAPDFEYLDVLGALEIMDPKTDSGMIVGDDNVEDSPEIENLLPEEILWIMDQLLAREISWHNGNPLAQTVYTCTYLSACLLNYDGNSLESATFLKNLPSLEPTCEHNLTFVVLRSYVLGMGRSCDCIREELQKGNIYEEEDIATNTAGLDLLSGISVSKVSHLLREAIDVVRSYSDTGGSEALQGIKSRLEFRRQLLELLSSTSTSSKARRTAIEVCLELLQGIVSTLKLGKEVPNSFTTRIQRKLSIQVPPRPMVTVDPKEAVQGYKRLLENLLEIEMLYDYKSPHEVFNYFDYFASRTPSALPYIRSFLQSKFIENNVVLSRESSDDFLKQMLIEICHPRPEYFPEKSSMQAEHPLSSQFKISQSIQSFLDRATPMCVDLFRIKCHNKSRQRRNLAKLVQDWEMLQLEIEKIDMELLELIPQNAKDGEYPGPKHAFPLCSWVYNIKLSIIENVLALGFELDLYRPAEYVLIYGYMRHSYLMHNQQLERIRSHVHLPKKKKKGFLYIDYLILRNSAMENLSHAYCSVFIVLKAIGLTRVPTRDKTSEYMRYTLRLKPFWGLSSPEILAFETFQKAFSVGDTIPEYVQCLKQASQAILVVRNTIEVINKMDSEQTKRRFCEVEFKEELKNLTKSCIGLSILIESLGKLVLQGRDEWAKKTVKTEKKYHPYFSVISIVDKQSRNTLR